MEWSGSEKKLDREVRGSHSVFLIDLFPFLFYSIVVVAASASETGHNPSQNINRVAAFSAIGPAPDGRVKPDISAPGYSIVSSISGVRAVYFSLYIDIYLRFSIFLSLSFP